MRNPVRVNIVATVLIVSSVLLVLGLSGIAAPQVQRQAQRVVTPTVREADQIKQRVRPVIIRSGAVQRAPALRTNSPYYAAQLVSKFGNLPFTLIEVDYYYVRVIPMHGPNQAGVPAIPVDVTVRRPRPCPKTTADITVRPPSARIVWYMRPNFFDSYGAAHDRWYVVNPAQFLPLGLHQLDVQKPEEKAWYDEVVAVFESIVNYFSNMMTAISVTFDMLENFAVDVTAKAVSYAMSGGIVKLDDCDECKGVMKAGLQAVMAYYGIPPTLPTGPELLNMSTEYLIEAGADELGLGAVYDAYQSLPDEVKQKMQGDAKNLSQELVQANKDAMKEQIEKYTCSDVPDLLQIGSQGFFLDPSKPVPTKKSCRPRIPDPIFNSVHPATVMVYVENRNNVATDGIVMNVTDSRGLFNPGTTRVPPLRPGQSLSIPVLLTENTGQFLDINGGKCPTKDVVTVSGEVSCQMQKWFDKFFQGGEFYQRPIQPVTFRVSFKIGSGFSEYSGLDAQSSGTPVKSVIVVDEGYLNCSIQGAIRYPQGWIIETPTKSIIAETWDNLFDEAHPNPNNGMLRAK